MASEKELADMHPLLKVEWEAVETSDGWIVIAPSRSERAKARKRNEPFTTIRICELEANAYVSKQVCGELARHIADAHNRI